VAHELVGETQPLLVHHPVFVDQKTTAMEMILHGHRIATNGDVRLQPTPEQWDLVAISSHATPTRQTV
jgi:hypothetical protein